MKIWIIEEKKKRKIVTISMKERNRDENIDGWEKKVGK